MREVKLELVKVGQLSGSEIHGEIFTGQEDPNGITFVCGNCEKPIIKGFVSGFIEMAGVDLVCQHCSSHNYLDTTKA